MNAIFEYSRAYELRKEGRAELRQGACNILCRFYPGKLKGYIFVFTYCLQVTAQG